MLRPAVSNYMHGSRGICYHAAVRGGPAHVMLAPPAHQHRLPDAAPLPHRQGARRVRPGRHAAHRRHRSHLGVRLRAGIGHPRQGQGAHAAVGVLVRRARRRRPESLHHDGRRDVPGGGAAIRRRSRRPIDAGAQDTRPSTSSASRAGTCRARAGRSISRRARVCGIPLPGRTRGIRSPARADLHAGDQGEHRPRHQHHEADGHAPAGRRGAGRAPARR